VNGLVAAAGLHFADDADIVVAAENAEFLDSHVNVGAVENTRQRHPVRGDHHCADAGGHDHSPPIPTAELPKLGDGGFGPYGWLSRSRWRSGTIFWSTPSWSLATIASAVAGIIGLSFVVATGYAGQITFLPFAIAGVAAAAGVQLASVGHFPFLANLVVSLIVGGVDGGAAGLPAFRLRGIELAVTTSFLRPGARHLRRLFAAIREFAGQGRAVVVVEQHLRYAEMVGTRVLVMHQGRFALELSGDELQERAGEIERLYLGGPET
jgi:hypothetical protein